MKYNYNEFSFKAHSKEISFEFNKEIKIIYTQESFGISSLINIYKKSFKKNKK